MSVYFILLNADDFSGRIVPALAAARRHRSFAPCRELCNSLLPTVTAHRESFFAGSQEPLLVRAARDLPFDRNVWRALVGEILLFAAAEVPELETAPDTLRRLLAPEEYEAREIPRERFAAIQQAHFGTRDLNFGNAVYRPDHVGWNDLVNVSRLADYLNGVRAERWTVEDLAGLRDVADEDLSEELEYAQEWYPALSGLYRRARDRQQIVVCEVY